MPSPLDQLRDEAVDPSEITLSTPSLLGIFFGLVLVCGVFFGFGYSMGRSTAHDAHGATPEDAAVPQPAVAIVEQPEPAVIPPSHIPAAEPTPPPVHPPRRPAAKPVETREPEAAPSSTAPMVQIAAVARREDADVLVTALRQRGYGVVIRNEPQDKLLHIQVGPFADRNQATDMKKKLLSDGYNAIIKQ